MNITKKIKDNVVNIAVEGEINSFTANDFEKEVMDKLDTVNELFIDFKKTSYISSAGLRVLMQAYKVLAPEGKITVVNANDEIKEVFEITMFSDVVNIK